MNAPEYTLRVARRVSEVPAAAWNALVREGGSPFVEHTWLDLLEQSGCVGGSTGWLPAHMTLWRRGMLVAAAPAYAKQHSEGEFVFDWSWAEVAERIGVAYYPKLVVAVPFTPAPGDRILVAPGEDRDSVTRIMADAARKLCESLGASGVHVLFSREPEAALWEERGYLRRLGLQFHWFREGLESFDGYLARFASKKRAQIKRELRSVHDAGIVVETLAPEAHTREVALAMHGFYSSTIAKHGIWGRLYLNERFFQGVVERFQSRLAWVVARDGRTGRLVAGAFNVVGGKTLYGRYWGASIDVPFLHFVVCYYAGIRFCIERGLDVFEPGAGGEHKKPRGFSSTLTHSAHWLSDRRLHAALTHWAQREQARIRDLIGDDDCDHDRDTGEAG